jgi:hypothetical protein
MKNNFHSFLKIPQNSIKYQSKRVSLIATISNKIKIKFIAIIITWNCVAFGPKNNNKKTVLKFKSEKLTKWMWRVLLKISRAENFYFYCLVLLVFRRRNNLILGPR